mmetsp:Transcript_77994/g.156101  ORF Transcript_77994/g.156101 Transcript_77994/m.156101 type:complete len:152 (+) Transcript_77994:208-663(+)
MAYVFRMYTHSNRPLLTHLLSQILIRPGAESWMFDEDGNLAENQVKFDWKSVEYRDDQLGGCDPDMSLGPIDEKELVNIAPMLEMFTNTLEVLEASNGVYRFKYWGLVKNQSGMECWGRQMILENHPEPDSVKTVSFLTKRKRDTNLGDKM